MSEQEYYLKVRSYFPAGDPTNVQSWPGDGLYLYAGQLYVVGGGYAFCFVPPSGVQWAQYMDKPQTVKPKEGFSMTERGLATLLAIAQKPELATELLNQPVPEGYESYGSF